jgi:dihydroorotate dehydrogenase electron transfer subunit
MGKRKESAVVLQQTCIAPNIYDMWIDTQLAQEAKPGQFINIYPKNPSTLLPRPISICEADRENNRLRVVYRIAGKGTTEFSGYQKGETIEIMGTLGNGFPLAQAKNKTCFLMGGGIGIPPMLQLAKELKAMGDCEVNIIAGYRDAQLFLADDFAQYGRLYLATEDGSAGSRGNVMNAIEENGLQADVIYACGPMPMLRAIKQYAAENKMEAYISLEERMACGVGACLGCVCRTTQKDHHSHVNNARICTDGPVFEAKEVEI